METISKHIGEGFGKGELYAALAYDSTDAFGGMAIKNVRFNPATGVASIAIGTSTTHWSTTTANTKVISIYADVSVGTGDNRGIYNRLYFKTAGVGGGESLRSYTEITGVAIGTAHGAHLSLGMGESTTKGSVTGLGVAVRATLGFPNIAMDSGGTYAAIMSEIYSFGTSCDPAAVTELSFLRLVAGGDSTGRAAIDDKAYLLVLDGVAEGANNMVVASATEANYASAARCKINGVEKWLMFASASG